MPLLLDAYNVLHCTHVLPDRWAQIGAVGLCRLIDRAGPRGGARVVCDGAPPKLTESNQTIGAVELIYAGGGKDADSLIERLIEESSAPDALMVVSNDRRIQSAARRRGARIVASEDFLRRLARSLRPAKPTDPKPQHEPDADHWLEQFGLIDTPSPGEDVETETEFWLREFGFDEGGDR